VIELHSIAASATWVLGDNRVGLPTAFAEFARTVSPMVVDAMWQGAAVAVGLLLALRLGPRVSAAHRFVAWSAGFALVAALPFLPSLTHLFGGASIAGPVSSVPGSPRAFVELNAGWALAIAALWIGGSVFRFVELAAHSVRLRRLWKTATPVAGEILQPSVGSPHAVVCTTTRIDRPSVIGFFAPRILIPEWLYARLSPQELEQVVLHEMEHLRRHDDWTNLIQKLLLVLFPLNPALAWIERRLCREREMACDEGVVQKTQAPRAYAACLASLAERGMERDLAMRAEALSLAAWRRRPELVHRVHGILWRKPALSPVASRVLLSVVGCGLVAGSVELARCPQVIGFSAAPKPLQAEMAKLNDAGYVPSGAAALAESESGYHMVQAKALLPMRRGQGSALVKAHPRSEGVRESTPSETQIASRQAVGGAPRETLLKAEMPAANADQPATENSGAPQYIILTSVERVAVPQNWREIADYDIDAPSDQQPDVAKQATNENTTPVWAAPQQVVVTRLIFRLDAENKAVSSQASDAKTQAKDQSTSKANPDSAPAHQRAAIRFGDGWLVFQL